MNYYLKALQNYATFTGRSIRSEYWYFFLINIIARIVLMAIGYAIKIPMLDSIYGLAVLVPTIAVGVRRMHDIDKSGWYLLIPIYNIILLCTEGTPGTNQYGPDPFADLPEFDFDNNTPAS